MARAVNPCIESHRNKGRCFKTRPLNALRVAIKGGRPLSGEWRATNSLPGGGLSAIPTHAGLTEPLGGLFTLTSQQGAVVQARLIDAPAGVPMNDDYVCHHARFELPLGVQFPQDNYRVDAPTTATPANNTVLATGASGGHPGTIYSTAAANTNLAPFIVAMQGIYPSRS